MNEKLKQFVEEIVEATNLCKKIKRVLKSELCSHVLEKERELQLQGYSEEKIFEIISSEFNKDHMVEEFKQVHNGKLRWGGRIMTVIVTLLVLSLIVAILDPFGVSDGTLGPLVSFSYRVFGWLGLDLMFAIPSIIFPFNFITSVVIILISGILKNILVAKNFSLEQVKIIRNFIIGGGLVLHWLAMIASSEGRHFPEHPLIEGGFPIKVFNYVWNFPSGMGPEWGIPLTPWPRFLINLFIWTLVAGIIYKFLPERLRDNKKLSSIIMVTGLTATLYGFSFLVWQFAD